MRKGFIPISLGPRRDERDHSARVRNSHQAMQIMNVLVAFLVFLQDFAISDEVLPENVNAVAQFNALGSSRCSWTRPPALLFWCTRRCCAWDTLVGVEPGGDAPITQP